MPDITLRQDGQLPIATHVRYKDMGDGTYALVNAAALLARDCHGNCQMPLVDSDQGALVMISEYEHAVHESERFKASYVRPHGSELANDASADFLVRIGAIDAHARVRIEVGGDSELLIYEAPTTSANGNQVDSVSKNRQILGTATVLFYEGPTVTNVGTLLFHWFIAGGTGGSSIGTGWGDTHWVLRANTDYLIRITNRSAGAGGIQFSVGLGWSEQ